MCWTWLRGAWLAGAIQATLLQATTLVGCLVSCTGVEPGPPHANPSVWLAAPLSEPGCARAEEPSRPGSSETPESTVFREPGSHRAGLALVIMSLVYN